MPYIVFNPENFDITEKEELTTTFMYNKLEVLDELPTSPNWKSLWETKGEEYLNKCYEALLKYPLPRVSDKPDWNVQLISEDEELPSGFTAGISIKRKKWFIDIKGLSTILKNSSLFIPLNQHYHTAVAGKDDVVVNWKGWEYWLHFHVSSLLEDEEFWKSKITFNGKSIMELS